MTYKILMIDDHPSQIEGYKTILSYNSQGLEIETTAAYNSEAAYAIITDPDRSFHMVFLDRNLPPFPEKKIYCGEELALLVRKHFPDTKLVMLTSHSEAFLLYNLVKKVSPEGLLVKSDFTGDDLLLAFGKILLGETYHSETVKTRIRDLLSKEAFLDSHNRQLIELLSKGLRTKSIAEQMHLSVSAVEKRKNQIKDYLGIEKGGDEEIVAQAKKSGYI